MTRTLPNRRALFAWVLALVLPSLVWPQRPDSKPKRSRGETSPGAAKLLKRLDRNQDGFLQPDEIPQRARLQVELAARRRGLDTSKPLRLDQLASSAAAGPAASKISDKTTLDKEEPPPKDSAQNRADVTNSGSSPVPGFGTPNVYPAVPGFGRPLSGASLESATSLENGKASEGKNAGPSASKADTQLKRYAKSLLVQYDKNKSGQLEKEEWSRMRGNPEQADRNRDEILSVNELAQHLSTYGNRRDGKARSDSGTKRPSAWGSRAMRRPGDLTRFLHPHERLPKGLPEWFVRKDANGDGQISMAEFSTSWTAGKRHEFNEADINRDGFIVPGESLQAQAGAKSDGPR